MAGDRNRVLPSLLLLFCYIRWGESCTLDDGSLFKLFNVQEEQQIGEVVGSLSFLHSDTIRNLRLAQESPYFNFDTDTHEFTVKSRIDLDSGISSFQALTIECSLKAGPMLEIEVEFALYDVNDLSPVFIPSADYHFEASEALEPGDQIGVIEAKDGDKRNLYITFELHYNNNLNTRMLPPFNLRPLAGDKAALTLNSTLDYEVNRIYQFSVIAKDCHDRANCSAGQLRSTANITITVGDADDLPPKFDNDVYTPSIFEDTVEGTLVVQIVARDLDELSSRIIYSIEGDDSQYFTINRDTGMVVVTDDSMITNGQKFSLQAKATQFDDDTKFDSCTILITVVPSTGNGPKFTEDRYSVSVSEEKTVGSTVLSITVNNRVTSDDLVFTIADSSFTSKFSLVKTGWNTVEIRLTELLDYEQQKTYTYTLQVSDSNVMDEAVIEITVQNVNDNNPEFSQPSYVVSVEYSALGEVVRVQATDADEPDSSNPVAYSIVSPSNGLFSIDNDGIVRFSAAESSYTQTEYTIHIQATDMSRSPRLSTTSIILTIVQPDTGALSTQEQVTDDRSKTTVQKDDNLITYVVSAVAGTLLVIVVILIVCFLRRRKQQASCNKKKSSHPDDLEPDMKTNLPPSYTSDPESLSNNNTMSSDGGVASPHDVESGDREERITPNELNEDDRSMNSDFQRNLESFSYKNLCNKENEHDMDPIPTIPQSAAAHLQFHPPDSGRSSLHGERSPYQLRSPRASSLDDTGLRSYNPASNISVNSTCIAEVPEGFRSSANDIPDERACHVRARPSRSTNNSFVHQHHKPTPKRTISPVRYSSDQPVYHTSDYESNTPTPDVTAYTVINPDIIKYAGLSSQYPEHQYTNKAMDYDVEEPETGEQMTIYF